MPRRSFSSLAVTLPALVGLFALAGCNYAPYAPARTSPFVVSTPEVTRAQGFFKSTHGTTLFEQSWRPLGDVRAAIVFVHGLMDHSERYDDTAMRLAKEGYAVYAFDLRGHGHSEGVRVDLEKFDDYLDDLDREIAIARGREPGKPLFLFGHSMGGAIVTLDVIERKPEVRGIVLSAPALGTDVGAAKELGTEFIAALDEQAPVFSLDLADFSRDPKVIEEARRDPLLYSGSAPARTALALLGAIDAIQAHMEDVTVPFLVLHGGADKVTPIRASRDFARRARSTDKTLKVYDGLYHDLLHEPERAKVVGDILAWLDQRAPKRVEVDRAPEGSR